MERLPEEYEINKSDKEQLSELSTQTKITGIVEELRNFSQITGRLQIGYSVLSQNGIKIKFCKYVYDGKLGSNEDKIMEEIYNMLVYDNTNTSNNTFQIDQRMPNYERPTRFGGWKLKYIKDNKNKNINTVVQEISKKEAELRPINKSEISLIPQKVKNYYNNYSFMIKGINVVIKSLAGSYKTIGEFVGGVYRSFKNFNEIKSDTKRINPKTKVTQCSATAQANAKKFGITLPSGNAKEGVHKQPIDTKHFIGLITKQENRNSYINIKNCTNTPKTPIYANFADLSVESDTKNGKRYGHRAVAFKNSNNQRYVLDPYYSGGYNTKPIPRDMYPKSNKVERINFYNAPIQSKSA